MLNKLINILYKLMSDLAISSYLSSNLFLGKNSVKITFILKIFRKFISQRQVPLLDKNGNKVIHIITILERIILFFPYLLMCLKIQQENKTFPIRLDFVFESLLVYVYYFVYIFSNI